MTLSVYARYLAMLRENGSPPAPRYAAMVKPRRQRSFSLTDEAFELLSSLAYDLGLRRQQRNLPNDLRNAQTLDTTEVGNISLLLELIGEGVYTVTPTPLEQIE